MTKLYNYSDLVSALTDAGCPGLDGYVSRLTGGNSGAPEAWYSARYPRVQGAAAQVTSVAEWTDLWEYEGNPSHGAAPSSFVNPTNTTPGALPITNAVTGNKRCFTAYGTATLEGMILVYDRLMQVGGLSGVVTTAQNLNGGSDATITRYTNGVGNQIWLTVSTACGATATTATVNYKDGSGNALTTMPIAFGGSTRTEAQKMFICSNQSGAANTVASASSVTLLASTLTAGAFNIVIAHPLFVIPIASAEGSVQLGFTDMPLPIIQPNAALGFAFMPKTTGSPIIQTLLQFAENM